MEQSSAGPADGHTRSIVTDPLTPPPPPPSDPLHNTAPLWFAPWMQWRVVFKELKFVKQYGG